MTDKVNLHFKPFWVVWDPSDPLPAVREIASEEQAIEEAEALARARPETTWLVMRATHARMATDMLRVTLTESAQQPY